MHTLPDINQWTWYKNRSPARISEVYFDFVTADFYKTELNGQEWSCGLFKINDQPIMMAWGIMTDEHCSMHAIYTNKSWTAPSAGCPIAKKINNQTLSLQHGAGLIEFSSTHPKTKSTSSTKNAAK